MTPRAGTDETKKCEARQILIIVYVVVLAGAMFAGFGALPKTRHKPKTYAEQRIEWMIEAMNEETMAKVQAKYTAVEGKRHAVCEEIKRGSAREVWGQVTEINFALIRLLNRYPEYAPYLRTEEQQMWMPLF